MSETYTIPSFCVVDDPTFEEIDAVAVQMRTEDVSECRAWNLEPEDAARAMQNCDMKWLVFQHGHPVFVFGLKQHIPGSFYLAGFGSDAIEKCTLRALSRWGNKTWLPSLFEEFGVRRLEAIVPVTANHSIDWLTWCGMHTECRVKDFIKRGDAFVRLSYTVTDYEDDVSVYVPNPRRTGTPVDPDEEQCRNSSGC